MPESDMDIVLFYESSTGNPKESSYSQERASLVDAAKEVKEEIWDQRKREGGRMRNIPFRRIIDVNPELLDQQIQQKDADRLSYLFILSTGDKINEARDFVRQKYQSLDSTDQKELMDKLLNRLVNMDIGNKKMKERIAKNVNEEELGNTRRELWQSRVKKILGITGE